MLSFGDSQSRLNGMNERKTKGKNTHKKHVAEQLKDNAKRIKRTACTQEKKKKIDKNTKRVCCVCPCISYILKL